MEFWLEREKKAERDSEITRGMFYIKAYLEGLENANNVGFENLADVAEGLADACNNYNMQR